MKSSAKSTSKSSRAVRLAAALGHGGREKRLTDVVEHSPAWPGDGGGRCCGSYRPECVALWMGAQAEA